MRKSRVYVLYNDCAMFNCMCDKKLLEKAFMLDDLCGSEVSTGLLEKLGCEKSLYNIDACFKVNFLIKMDIFLKLSFFKIIYWR